ncbi:MAG: endonuclease/exonuclease/phosphatase family protein [Patescibacteria group bacterium]
MRRRAGILALLLLLACGAPAAATGAGAGAGPGVAVEIGAPEPAPAGRPILLRVATFNLHHGVDPHGRPSLDTIGRFLADNRVDLAALQEVDRNWSLRSGLRDQAAVLAEMTGLHLAFLPTLSRGAQGYGLAVLSRFPILREFSGLYRASGSEPRGYLGAEIDTPGGKISFVATHLGLSAAERDGQTRELAAVLAALPGPLVMAGDLNLVPDAVAAGISSLFRDALAAAGRGHEGTLLTAPGLAAKRVDYLFVTPEFRIESCVVPEVDLSDHRPILASLSLYVDSVAGGCQSLP